MSPRLACIALLACFSCGPSNTPTTTPSSGDAAPRTDGDPGPPEDTVATARQALAPWMQDLFDDSRRLDYAWEYEVDVHDVEGSVATAAGTLSCAMNPPTEYELDGGVTALGTCRTCEFEASADQPESADFNPTLDECYVGSREGLWIVEALPAPGDGTLATLLDEAPYLASEPVARQAERDGETAGLRVESTAVTIDGQKAEAWCRTDEFVEIYDPSTSRCFAVGPGLFDAAMAGRSGPSVESYEWVQGPPG